MMKLRKFLSAVLATAIALSTMSVTTLTSSATGDFKSNVSLYSRWGRDGGGHALVIRSYEVSDTGVNSIGFMDPNKTYYTAMTFGTSFSNGTYVYTWTTTIY